MKLRVVYVAGPGDVVEAHRWWTRGEPAPGEVSVTFSGQIEDALRERNCHFYMQSTHRRAETVIDGDWTIENRPQRFARARGIFYHLLQYLRGVRILAMSIRLRADVVLIDSGVAHWFSLIPFRVARIPVIPILHNAFWAAGHRPAGRVKRFVQWLDAKFWRWVPVATIVVSPECERQILQLAGKTRGPVFQARAQFMSNYFAAMPLPPPHKQRPFRVMYAGRIVADKGIFDLVSMAKTLEEVQPGGFVWEVCGSGPAIDDLRKLVQDLRLQQVVDIRGRLDRHEMAKAYGRSHVVIVPTRSSFAEALAMVAAEAILAGRPCVTSRVVPAFELLADACVEAVPDDVKSYVDALTSLAGDESLYHNKVLACPRVKQQFLDRELGMAAALKRAFTAARIGGART